MTVSPRNTANSDRLTMSVGPKVPEILQSPENNMQFAVFILVGSILLLSAERRTKRLNHHGIIDWSINFKVMWDAWALIRLFF